MLEAVLVVAAGAALVLAGGLVLARLSLRPVPVGLVGGRLRPCRRKPNAVCSEPGTGAAHAVAPFAFPVASEGDADAAFRSLVDLVATDPRARLVRATEGYAHAVWRTPFFGFADDVELRLDREAGIVHVRSAARVGHSDLGTNRRRIEALRARWRPPAPGG